MRPLQLTLQGFTAFRQHTQLDFSDLELFALVGPTGSGKSSLLDAMTFALYGNTPRLGATGLDALISQGESGMSVSLTFEVGGQVYRVARSKGRRSADNIVKLEKQEGERWVDQTGNRSSRATNELIGQIIGLNFKTFTKSVLLPQGDFAKLLHGTGKERQELLGELLGLEHVKEMFTFASDRAKELKHQLGSQNVLLEGEYANVSAEVVAQLRQERERISTELERWQEEREALQERQQRLRGLEQVWKTKEDTARRLSAQENRAASVQAGLAQAERARQVAGVIPLLDQAERTRIAAQREAGELRSAQAQAAQAEAAWQQANTELEAAQLAETRLPQLEEREGALRLAEADAARLRRAGGTPQSTHPQPLPWDEDAFEVAREAAQKLEKLRLERAELELAKTTLKAAQDRHAAETQAQAQAEAELGRVTQEGVEAKEAVAQAQAALEAARVQAGLSAYHSQLHAGEPCPLCGQTVHQVPASAGNDLTAYEQKLQALQANQDERRNRYSELRGQIKNRAAWLQEKGRENADWASQLAQREQDARLLESKITGNPADDVQRLLAGLAERVRQAGSDPAKLRKSVLSDIKTIQTNLKTALAAQAQAASAHAAAQATHQAAQRLSEGREGEAAQAEQALATALAGLGLDAAAARAAALPESDIQALEQAGRKHAAETEQLRAALADLERQLGVAPFDPAELSQVSRDLTAAEAALTGGREQAGVLAEQERQAQDRLRRKEELAEQAKTTAATLDTWQTLTNSLKANEFQQFLLSEVEAALLTGAGHLLFDISDGRYRLSLASGEYVVQDLWNAGEMRGVKTLSGGETFLASLALAIALSDYLAGNKILGALFLDEGFGTLDPQALESVATALENLRTQGRMVGVITHVESLSERLPSRLIVTKSVAGSTVMRLDAGQ